MVALCHTAGLPCHELPYCQFQLNFPSVLDLELGTGQSDGQTDGQRQRRSFIMPSPYGAGIQ